MGDTANRLTWASGATADTAAQIHRRLMKGYFLLEGMNALATAYYLSYLFFYTQRHFGFGNRANLLLTTLHGFTYVLSASSAGWLAHKFGYRRLLRVGFAGMMVAMVAGGIIPRAFGYSRIVMLSELPILFLWTSSMCFTWPTLQALLSRQAPDQLPRIVGIYNVIWSGCSAVAFLTGGALLDRFGGEIMFWLPAGVHALQIVLLIPIGNWQKLSLAIDAGQPPKAVPQTAASDPRRLAKAKNFLRLAWIANPLAYTAMYGLIPVIPKLANHLGLTATDAGVICSVWYWVRLGSFIWFWLWAGWHYRFRWLLTAFLALIAGFLVFLLSAHIWMVIVAQVIFGLAVGLIYYSSLFYSMDAGVSQGKGGGIHEAAIGVGIFLGPAAGAMGLYAFPSRPNAGTWNIGVLLLLGLIFFLLTRLKFREQK